MSEPNKDKPKSPLGTNVILSTNMMKENQVKERKLLKK